MLSYDENQGGDKVKELEEVVSERLKKVDFETIARYENLYERLASQKILNQSLTIGHKAIKAELERRMR